MTEPMTDLELEGLRTVFGGDVPPKDGDSWSYAAVAGMARAALARIDLERNRADELHEAWNEATKIIEVRNMALDAAEAEVERLRKVVDAGVERHSRFHPNLWAVERNCSECIVLAALAPKPKEPKNAD